MVNEEWRDIEGYKGLYKISNLGNIISFYGKYKKQLKKHYNKSGYQIAILIKDGKYKTHYVHRLVAQAFIPNTENKPCIDHINTDRTDNRVENLRWVTQKENCNNPKTITAYSCNNNMLGKVGKTNHLSKPIIQLNTYDELVKKWDCVNDVVRELGFCHSHISKCCKEKVKLAYGYKWGYVCDYERIPFKVFDLDIYRKISL